MIGMCLCANLLLSLQIMYGGRHFGCGLSLPEQVTVVSSSNRVTEHIQKPNDRSKCLNLMNNIDASYYLQRFLDNSIWVHYVRNDIYIIYHL